MFLTNEFRMPGNKVIAVTILSNILRGSNPGSFSSTNKIDYGVSCTVVVMAGVTITIVEKEVPIRKVEIAIGVTRIPVSVVTAYLRLTWT